MQDQEESRSKRAKMVHVVAICGSLKVASSNHGLLRAISKFLPSECTIDIIVPSDLPLFNQDLETDSLPEAVVAYHNRLRGADAFLFAACEYNYSISAPLKNAIDWGSRSPHGNLFNDKPGAVVSAAGGAGGLRAQEHLRDIALFLNLHMMNQPQIQVRIFENPSPIDFATGDLTDAKQLENVAKFTDAFVVWSKRINSQI